MTWKIRKRCARRVPLHGQLLRSKAVDRNILVNDQLIACQRNNLPVERRIELNDVPIARRSDRVAQRTRSAIGRARDDERRGLDTFNRSGSDAK